MNTTIADALAEYNEEVARFAAWVDPIDQDNPGPRWGTEEWFPWQPLSEPGGWSTQDNCRLHNWNAKLKGMEAALGLSFDEIRTVYEGVGLQTSLKASPAIQYFRYRHDILRRVLVPVEPAPVVSSIAEEEERARRTKSSPRKEARSPKQMDKRPLSGRPQTLDDWGKALVCLLYEQNVVEVNLSQERFRRTMAKELEATGVEPTRMVKNAFKAIRERWGQPIAGDESEQKFRRFVLRLRRDFAASKYAEILDSIRDRDQSEDAIEI